jgi:TonB family protein
MRAKSLLSLLAVAVCMIPAIAGRAQESSANRKIVQQTTPVYPEIAKKMNLSGTVKIIATVAPDGKVKTVEPMGGSPVLIMAAKEAVSHWKFATGPAESREVIELHFNPQGN